MLLTVITGDVHARAGVTLPPFMAERLEASQPGVLPEFESFGLASAAGFVEDGGASSVATVQDACVSGMVAWWPSTGRGCPPVGHSGQWAL